MREPETDDAQEKGRLESYPSGRVYGTLMNSFNYLPPSQLFSHSD